MKYKAIQLFSFQIFYAGFAELQTDLDELTGDVAGGRLPYVDMKSYLLTSLFPGATDHPTLHELQVCMQVYIHTNLCLLPTGKKLDYITINHVCINIVLHKTPKRN